MKIKISEVVNVSPPMLDAGLLVLETSGVSVPSHVAKVDLVRDVWNAMAEYARFEVSVVGGGGPR